MSETVPGSGEAPKNAQEQSNASRVSADDVTRKNVQQLFNQLLPPPPPPPPKKKSSFSGSLPPPPPPPPKKSVDTTESVHEQDDIRAASLIALEDADLQPALTSMIQKIKNEGEVFIHNNVSDPNTHRYKGYETYGSEAAKKNARYKQWTPQASRALNDLMQVRVPSKDVDIASEGVRLSPVDQHGKREIVYTFTSNNYVDDTGRPASLIGVGIRLDAAEAEHVYTLLQQNPASVRTFFIASTKNVERSNYIWNERKPPYDQVDANRTIIFAQQNDNDSNPLDLQLVERVGESWNSTDPKKRLEGLDKNLPIELKKFEQQRSEKYLAALNESVALRKRQQLRNSSKPQKQEPKKSWFKRLFE